jgi:acyl dehydratase
VTESEHVQLTTLFRNSHPLHTDEHYCKLGSFAKTRVVYGGLVLSWVLALTSRDTAGNGVWDLGLDDGAHPSGVLAGDTLFAASKIIAKEPRGPHAGAVTMRVVGLKNTPARPLLERGADLFTPELGKATGKVTEKVVEITRTLLVRRRSERNGGG